MPTDLQSFINHCHQGLCGNDLSDEAQAAHNYLCNVRGLNNDTIKAHRLGYCFKQDDIPNAVKGFGEVEGKKEWDLSYFLRGRIITPIFDVLGDAVGLSSRAPSTEPGNVWWNLPKPFYKSHHLFLLSESKKHIFKEDKVFVVEGYMDALMLYQHGIKNVVGIMGTTMSFRQLGLIARYCERICLCFDSDANESGEKGKNNTIMLMSKFEFHNELTVIDSLPVKEDPASFVQRHGRGKFLEKERVISLSEIKGIARKNR